MADEKKDVTLNISKGQFFISLFLAIMIFVGAIIQVSNRMNTLEIKVETNEVMIKEIKVWAQQHSDANSEFQKEVLQYLIKLDERQKRVFEALGFKIVD